MATIKEDYVSFETAKLLKEKWFPQEYDRYHALVYNEEDYEDEYEVQRMVLQTQLIKAGTLSSYPIGVPEPKCYCPSQSMAMKWLREVHNIAINIGWGEILEDKFQWWCIILNQKDGSVLRESEYHATYEKACEAAIKYCLENLI